MSGKVEPIVVCPNGHQRKFYVTSTIVAAKVVQNAAGEQEWHHLPNQASVNIYYCCDCGAVVVVEHDAQGNIVEDK